MATVSSRYLARGTVDRDLNLLTAEEPLASLQRACGGTLGGALAIPELRSLVMKAQRYGVRLARQFRAIADAERINAWIELDPVTGTDGRVSECRIGIISWQSEEIVQEDEGEAAHIRKEAASSLADLTARLDRSQQVISVSADASDLAELKSQMESRSDCPWTDFVQIAGNAHHQPLHWRLLDGAQCRVQGSERNWAIHLQPLGMAGEEPSGFLLQLLAEEPLLRESEENEQHVPPSAPSLGQDLSPVLRQPINRIIANAETIRTRLAGPLADEYSEYAADIASAGQHLLSLIDDLSDLEIVESDDFVTAPDRIDLGDVARQACGILGVRAREKGIVLSPPSKGEGQLAIAEFRRVLQILINLINNAIRYSPEGSQVWVRLDRIGERALITVADQGHGIPAEKQDKVFEKFERLGRSGDGGSGLGLYISRRIARAMDGDLTLESASGQGARFTLSVPAAEERRKKPRERPDEGTVGSVGK